MPRPVRLSLRAGSEPSRKDGEDSPPRHRGHRASFQCADENGSDLLLRALCVSVVKIRAKRSQKTVAGSR